MARPSQNNRKLKRKQWTDQQMVDVIDDFTGNRLGAARKHSVPPSMLKDRLSGRVVHSSNPAVCYRGTRAGGALWLMEKF